MRSSKILLLCVLLVAAAACGGGGGGGGGGSSSSSTPSVPTLALSNGSTLAQVTGPNVLPVTVNGPSPYVQYQNEPTVSVTVCASAGSTSCVTFDNILLDTGDYGLRIFSQAFADTAGGPAVLGSLTPVKVSSVPLYECVEYGDGSKVWGPVVTAYVTLGGEQPTQAIPIQVIGSGTSDSTTGRSGHACSGATPSPSSVTAPFNGSLGLGLFVQDCGPECETDNRNRVYWTCNGSTCSGTTAGSTQQVQNPVASLPGDNNGVVLQFPSVSYEGASSVSGYLILGIGTESNNSPAAGVVAYGANSVAEFSTVYNGASYDSFLDTGSNGFFFPDTSITQCEGWYCPSSVLTLSAVNAGYTGSPSNTVQFQIANYSTLSASNNVFPDIGASMSGEFDWGLPFFLGRNVYVGIDGFLSTLGTGPYWAY